MDASQIENSRGPSLIIRRSNLSRQPLVLHVVGFVIDDAEFTVAAVSLEGSLSQGCKI